MKMRSGQTIEWPRQRWRLRYDGLQKALLGQDEHAFTVLAPGKPYHGQRFHVPIRTRLTTVRRRVARELEKSALAA